MSSSDNTSKGFVFSEALSQLAVVSAKLPPMIDHPAIVELAEKICRGINIARCDVSIDRTGYVFGVRKSQLIFCDSDDYDPERSFIYKKKLADGNEATYTAYPHKNAPDWTAGELEDIEEFLSVLYVINGRARMTNIVERYAFHDEEFDIYNLNYFLRTMEKKIRKNIAVEYGICRFNLRNFSSINAKIGRVNGTAVMKRFAEGLRDMIGEDGFLTRLGGDNFIAVFKKHRYDDMMKWLTGTEIETKFRGLPYVTLSAYAGYLMMTEEYTTPHHIMERLDTAFAMAKYKLKTAYVIYDESFKEERDRLQAIESAFFDAVDNEEFLVYYQPKVNIKDYTLSGAEALCRWKHDGRLVPPMEFIPALEQSNNICVLDFYMLEHVCKDIRRWIDDGYPIVKISVNMSRIHLGDSKFSETIRNIIDKYDVPHEYIEIELTETTTDVDFKELKEIVGLLHHAGISTSVDDFGVGYSSLNLIRDLPWNVLKIDKSFLPDAADENQNEKNIMLRHVISMAHQLGLECIVEGVETNDQVDLLRDCNCYLAQGYFFDKPLPVVNFEERLNGQFQYK